MMHTTLEQLLRRALTITLNKILNFPYHQNFICTIAFIAIVFVQEMLGLPACNTFRTESFSIFSRIFVFAGFCTLNHFPLIHKARRRNDMP